MKNLVNESPFFIPALTTVKNMHSYKNILEVLLESETKAYMLSALDLKFLISKELKNIHIEKSKNQNKIFFLDSGGFEKFNIPYLKKKWKFTDFISIIELFKPDIIVAFDEIHENINQDKSQMISSFLKTIELSEKVIQLGKKFEFIIHSNIIERIFLLLEEIKQYNKNLYAIGIPERNLGYSIRTRFNIVKQIVNFIRNELKWSDIHIHLMGCSDPIHMIEYSKLGINIFDGVHWQDLLIDPESLEFLDFSNLLQLNCKCKYCNNFRDNIRKNYNFEENFYNYYAINHNLNIYNNLWR